MSPSPLPFHLINAFTTSSPHTGNQAAVVVFPTANDPRSEDTEWMRLVARDFNYAETAYLVPLDAEETDQPTVRFGLRWFTPEVEVPLCGHATLASAFTVFSLYPSADRIEFTTKVSGALVALRTPSGDVSISLPAIPSSPSEISSSYKETTIDATGLTAEKILEITPYEFAGKSVIVQIDPNVDLASLKVDSKAIAAVTSGLFIITQANTLTEISSRVFAPGLAIDEDSVTGAAHAALVPYYLSRPSFLDSRSPDTITINAKQLSARGGKMDCRSVDGRVELVGACSEFGRGEMRV